jgi:hypothetical protein
MFWKLKGISHLGLELATAGGTRAKRLKGTQMLGTGIAIFGGPGL